VKEKILDAMRYGKHTLGELRAAVIGDVRDEGAVADFYEALYGLINSGNIQKSSRVVQLATTIVEFRLK
jgi:hypothetical protein